mgnify:CR=1 FL=1
MSGASGVVSRALLIVLALAPAAQAQSLITRHRLEDLVDMVPALREAAGELGARLTG